MAISLGAGLLGGAALSLIGGRSAGRSAERAAEASAAAQEQAAISGAQASAFRPVNVTTRFGESRFVTETDPETGLPVVREAGYSLAPDIAALQERLLGVAPGTLERGLGAYERIAPVEEAAQGLFGLGAQYLGESPEAIRQQYMAQQQALLEPSRMAEEQRLASSVFGRGRAGLNIGGGGQPELAALAGARRMQDLQLAAQAEQAAQQQIQFGQGLFGQGAGLLDQVPAYEVAALSPFSQQLSSAQAIEALGQAPLDIGAQLGGRSAQAGAVGGQLLAQGGTAAANTRLQGSLVGPTMMAGTLSNLTSNPYFLQSIGGMFNQPNLSSAPSWSYAPSYAHPDFQ